MATATAFESYADSGPEAAMVQFVSALNAQDAAGVTAMFHPDGKLLPAGMPMISGTDAISAFWQTSFDSGLSHIEKTPIEILVSGALAVQTSSHVLTFGDEKIPGKDTLVWQRDEDDQWRITFDIWARDE